jgi:hypothetical protein
MAVGFPTKVTYANGDVFSADDINSTNGTINLLGQSVTTSAGKNAVINGGMDIWQRGTSITTGNYVYTADRWQTWNNTVYTVSRQATGDTTNLPNIQYNLRFQRNSGSTSTTPTYLAQTLETANSIPYAGKAITFSFYARKGANYSGASSTIPFQVRQGTGTDQNVIAGMTGVSDVINSSATLTTTWQRFTYTATVSSSATQLGFFFNMTGVGTAGAADYFDITGVQLELGSTATTFARTGSTLGGELSLCQRYYQRYTSDGGPYGMMATGKGFNVNTIQVIIPLKTTMRVSASALDTSAASTFIANTGGTDVTSLTSIALNSNLCSTQYLGFDVTKNSSFTVGAFYFLYANNSTSSFIGVSAEI